MREVDDSAALRRLTPFRFTRSVCLLAAFPLAACTQLGGFSTKLPSGAQAYDIIPAPKADDIRDYKVGALDTLSITVFQEPDLTFKEIQVDAGGNLLFPLIGTVEAGGKTPHQLSQEIADRLDQHYLRSAQVSVVIEQSASQHITVEGNVTQPGVYDINGTSTLLEAMARAKSPTRTAKLSQVIVFRTLNGTRTGAVFDLSKIRNGQAPDPQLLGGDVVVIGFDAVKGAFRDFLSTAPLVGALNTFREY